jgi:hypothetical protein
MALVVRNKRQGMMQRDMAIWRSGSAIRLPIHA